MIRDTIGAHLKELRVAAALSQADLASRMDVAQTTVSKIEGAERLPPLNTVEAWASACGRDLVVTFPAHGAGEGKRDQMLAEHVAGLPAPAAAALIEAIRLLSVVPPEGERGVENLCFNMRDSVLRHFAEVLAAKEPLAFRFALVEAIERARGGSWVVRPGTDPVKEARARVERILSSPPVQVHPEWTAERLTHWLHPHDSVREHLDAVLATPPLSEVRPGLAELRAYAAWRGISSSQAAEHAARYDHGFAVRKATGLYENVDKKTALRQAAEPPVEESQLYICGRGVTFVGFEDDDTP